MRFRTLSDRWHAASNCMVPRTFISLTMLRAADEAGVADADACTTVSTRAASMTLAISGFRMSTRAKSASPIRARAAGSGSAASTPITRSTSGRRASRPASSEPMNLVTPVTRTTRPAMAVTPLRRMLSGNHTDRRRATADHQWRRSPHGFSHQEASQADGQEAVSYTHLRAHETDSYLVCRLLLEKKKKK